MKKFLTKEQSDELIKLGLDPQTADCVISDVFDTKKIQDPPDVPTWSLDSILELMPKTIMSRFGKGVLMMGWVQGTQKWNVFYQSSYYSKSAPELIDALFKLLKEIIKDYPDKIKKI